MSIDLLVPDSLSTRPGKRSAPLKGHHETSARAVVGLEGTIVDFDRMTIAALEPLDERELEVRVAGPAGLVVAKVHKIHERSASADTVRKARFRGIEMAVRATEGLADPAEIAGACEILINDLLKLLE